VLVPVGLFGWLAQDTLGQIHHLELASFLLLVLIGAWLCIRAASAIWQLWRKPAPGATPSWVSTPDQVHEHIPPTPIVTARPGMPSIRGVGPSSSPLAVQEPCNCGSPHHVNVNHQGPWAATVLAVGIRPCSGAVLVLAMSSLLGLWIAGVAAVLAMSMGTAITVSLFAILAVHARDWTLRRFRHELHSGLRYAGAAAGFLGGAFILVVGWTLFRGAYALEPARYSLGL
jgi:nickel/cobalt transporter (NicO) family protein